MQTPINTHLCNRVFDCCSERLILVIRCEAMLSIAANNGFTLRGKKQCSRVLVSAESKRIWMKFGAL